ncbi:MAG: hypothetical protein LBI53_00570 [Candidatus Peribacteria bacterium]|nr:hypothetical protein [Candidatus Peribacteria bacterium]
MEYFVLITLRNCERNNRFYLGIREGSYTIEKEWGKMIPVIFDISDEKQFPNLLKMIEFKKKAK